MRAAHLLVLLVLLSANLCLAQTAFKSVKAQILEEDTSFVMSWLYYLYGFLAEILLGALILGVLGYFSWVALVKKITSEVYNANNKQTVQQGATFLAKCRQALDKKNASSSSGSCSPLSGSILPPSQHNE